MCDINVIALDLFHELSVFRVVMSILSKVDNLNNPEGGGHEANQLCTVAQRGPSLCGLLTIWTSFLTTLFFSLFSNYAELFKVTQMCHHIFMSWYMLLLFLKSPSNL